VPVQGDCAFDATILLDSRRRAVKEEVAIQAAICTGNSQVFPHAANAIRAERKFQSS